MFSAAPLPAEMLPGGEAGDVAAMMPSDSGKQLDSASNQVSSSPGAVVGQVRQELVFVDTGAEDYL